jgi:hypothetical protein
MGFGRIVETPDRRAAIVIPAGQSADGILVRSTCAMPLDHRRNMGGTKSVYKNYSPEVQEMLGFLFWSYFAAACIDTV